MGSLCINTAGEGEGKKIRKSCCKTKLVKNAKFDIAFLGRIDFLLVRVLFVRMYRKVPTAFHAKIYF